MSKNLKVLISDDKIRAAVKKYFPEIECESASSVKDMSAVDFALVDENLAQKISERLSGEASLFIHIEDGDSVPKSVEEGMAEDFLVLPFRSLDFLRLVRSHQFALARKELENSIHELPRTVQRLEHDLVVAQKIQRVLIKDKFPAMSGISLKSKYYCGMKPGGDYFDVFELPFGNHVCVLMADSSSYALSGKFLHALMDFSLSISPQDVLNPEEIAKKVFAKIKDEMKEKDSLALLWCVIDRSKYILKYASAGNISLRHINSGNRAVEVIESKSKALRKEQHAEFAVGELLLEPKDRLVFLSDGWQEQLPFFPQMIEQVLESELDSQSLLNQLGYRLHATAKEEETEEDFFPEQDCSILVLDIAKNILRIAK